MLKVFQVYHTQPGHYSHRSDAPVHRDISHADLSLEFMLVPLWAPLPAIALAAVPFNNLRIAAVMASPVWVVREVVASPRWYLIVNTRHPPAGQYTATILILVHRTIVVMSVIQLINNSQIIVTIVIPVQTGHRRRQNSFYITITTATITIIITAVTIIQSLYQKVSTAHGQ